MFYGQRANEASEIPVANGMNNSAFKTLSFGFEIGLCSQISTQESLSLQDYFS